MTPNCRQAVNQTPKTLAVLASLVLLSILTGCGSGFTQVSSDPPPTNDYQGQPFTGKVLAGTTPIIGATVQIYTAGTTGNGSAPTPLLSNTLTTNSSGAFSVSSYICPTSTSILYLVATGGQAGTTAATNSGTVLMTSPGACDTVTSGASITLNELTTVASAYAFSRFLAPGAKLGATATNTSGIALAAGTLANLVNPATGAAPGVAFPSTGTAPTPKLDALANVLNACIVSTSASSSACSQLYSDATISGSTPSNTLDALLNIVRNPAANVAALYTLSTTSTAFTPVPAAAPSDWTLFVNYTGGGMNSPSGVAVDSTGRVWVASYYSAASLFSNTGTPAFANGITGNGLCNSYGAAVDGNDQVWITNEAGGCGGNTVTVLTSTGAQAAVYSAGGLNFPIAVAIDSSEDAWIVDYGDSSLTILTNGGTPLSGPNGYDGVSGSAVNFNFPVAVAVDSKRNGYIANGSSNTVTKAAPDGSSFTSFVVGSGPAVVAVAVDSADNVWAADYYSDSLGLITSAGQVLSGATGYAGGGLDHPQGVAVDGANNVWAINYRTPTNIGDALTELTGASAATPGTALSPAIGYGTDANIVEGFGIAIDAAGNVWITSSATNTLTEFIGLAAPVKTPLLGPVRIP